METSSRGAGPEIHTGGGSPEFDTGASGGDFGTSASQTMAEMPDHVHPGIGFEDVDLTSTPELQEWHVAYRVGEVGEENGDSPHPFIPLSLSFSEREVPAEMRTIKYGLEDASWETRVAVSDVDRQRLFAAALRRLPADIARHEAGDQEVRRRQFVRAEEL